MTIFKVVIFIVSIGMLYKAGWLLLLVKIVTILSILLLLPEKINALWRQLFVVPKKAGYFLRAFANRPRFIGWSLDEIEQVVGTSTQKDYGNTGIENAWWQAGKIAICATFIESKCTKINIDVYDTNWDF